MCSEILRPFDTRTLPGRHIVFCHLIPFTKNHYFVVDDRGILRATEPFRDRSTFLARNRDAAKARAFAGRRRVGARGSTWFWFVPTCAEGMPTRRFRQDRRLTQPAASAWNELLPDVREAFKPW